MANDEYVVDLRADNELSDEARDAAKALDAIPDKVTTKIDADAAEPKRDLEAVLKLVDRLGSSSARLVLQDNAKDIQRNVGDLLIDLDRLDAADPQVQIKIDQINELEGQLGTIETKVNELGSRPIDLQTGAAKSNLDELGKSAGSSKSVLANMVGNSVQDLGALGGVAGSVGVAIGQMGEYMVDAANDGDRLGTVFKNFAAVAGPIAAITVVVSALGSVLGQQEERAKRAAAAQDQLSAAMRKGGDEASNIADALRDNIAGLHEFDADARTAMGGFVEGVSAAAAAIPILGGAVGDAGQNITDVAQAFADAGVSAYDLGQALANGGQDVEAWAIALELAAKEGRITSDQASAGAQALREYGDAAAAAQASQALFNVDQKEANALLADTVKQKDPLSQMQDVWSRLFDDMADGSIDTKAAADAVNQLAAGLGLTQAQVIGLASQHFDDEMQAAADATKAAADAAKEAADQFVRLSEVQGALGELAAAFSQIGIRADVLSSIFDLGNAPLDAAAGVRDITIAIDGLSDAAKGVKLDDVLAGNVKADKLLDQLDALRPQIQGKIVDAFSAGGPEAATAMANSYIDQVTAELGNKIPRDEVAKLLGLENIEATVSVAVERSALENAKRQLDILAGLTGETPYTASIKLALEAGTITGEQAQILVQSRLAGAGVEVPAELAVPVTGPALAAAEAALNANPLTFGTGLDTTGAADAAAAWAAGEQPTVTSPLDIDPSKAEAGRQGFVEDTERTNPVVPVSADTLAALNTMLYLKIFAALLQPKVTVTADTGPAAATVGAFLSQPRTMRIDVGTGSISLPTASDLAARIGPVRVPIDLYVRTSPRLDGGG